MIVTTQVRTIRIKVDTSDAKGLTKLSGQFGKLNRNVKGISGGFSTLKRVTQGYFALISGRAITRSLDSFQLLEDRLKIFTGSTEKATEAFNDLAIAAKLTKSSINNLATSYNRIALATQELGLNQDQILATTVALQQTFRLAGATMAEAAASTIQLSQGLSSGQLRGQELRSVLEANVVFAGLLSEELGTTRGNLIKFAESGKITSDVVINTLAKNFDKLNQDAAKLGTTIEQSLTITLDALRLKLRDLNKEFNISGNFEKLAKLFVNNIDFIFDAIKAFAGSFVIVKLAAQFKVLFEILDKGAKLSIGATLLKLINPITATVAALTGLVLLAKQIDTKGPGNIGAKIETVQKQIVANNKVIENAQKRLDSNPNFITKYFAKDQLEDAQKNVQKLTTEVAKLKLAQSQGKTLEDVVGGGKDNSLFDRLSEQFKNLNIVIGKTGAGAFAKLNEQVSKGAISVEEYIIAIDKLKADELTKKFQDGKITLQDYNAELIKLNENLDRTANSGALDGIAIGAQQTATEIGNIATQLAKVTSNVLGSMEDAIFDFVKTGKFAFKDFAQSVLDDLTRVIIRLQIIKPLAQGLTSSFGGTGGGGTVASANGNVFNNSNVIPFATGGILSGPSVFPLSGGRTGLAGEAGPEAIMPLTRGANGKLGVQGGGGSGVTINVVNNSKAEVEQQESAGPNGQRNISFMIVDSVNKGFADGKFDKSLKESYSINRRGR